MLAVKGPDQRCFQGVGAKVFREHGRPRHRLEQHPMTTRGREQRDNQQDMAKAG